MKRVIPSEVGEIFYNAPEQEVAAWLAIRQSLDDGAYVAEQAGIALSLLQESYAYLGEKIKRVCGIPVITLGIQQDALEYANIKRHIGSGDSVLLERDRTREKICALLDNYPDDDGIVRLLVLYYQAIGEEEEAQIICNDLDLRVIKTGLLEKGYSEEEVYLFLGNIEFGL